MVSVQCHRCRRTISKTDAAPTASPNWEGHRWTCAKCLRIGQPGGAPTLVKTSP